jgi:TonB-dependent SusC/RagA subfamily outer membrane receptor
MKDNHILLPFLKGNNTMKTFPALILLVIAFNSLAQENTISESKAIVRAGEIKNQHQPLIIVDGVKILRREVNVLDSINPNQIERMEVLKGEQAIQQYGEEGKNGVVMITLKSIPKKEPLYIVDGLMVKTLFISPDDIESMNVLKGKENTSIYGTEGDAGVILITTKNSKKQQKK